MLKRTLIAWPKAQVLVWMITTLAWGLPLLSGYTLSAQETPAAEHWTISELIASQPEAQATLSTRQAKVPQAALVETPRQAYEAGEALVFRVWGCNDLAQTFKGRVLTVLKRDNVNLKAWAKNVRLAPSAAQRLAQHQYDTTELEAGPYQLEASLFDSAGQLVHQELLPLTISINQASAAQRQAQAEARKEAAAKQAAIVAAQAQRKAEAKAQAESRRQAAQELKARQAAELQAKAAAEQSRRAAAEKERAAAQAAQAQENKILAQLNARIQAAEKNKTQAARAQAAAQAQAQQELAAKTQAENQRQAEQALAAEKAAAAEALAAAHQRFLLEGQAALEAQVQALQQREAELKQDLHSAEAAQRAAAQQTVQAQQAAAQSEAQAAQAQAAAGAARQAVKRAASAEEKAQQLAAAQQAQQAARSAESTAKAQARAAQQARAAEGRQAAAAAAARSTLEKWQQHILDQKSSLSSAADKQAMRQARAELRAQQAAAQAQAQAEQQAQAAAERQALSEVARQAAAQAQAQRELAAKTQAENQRQAEQALAAEKAAAAEALAAAHQRFLLEGQAALEAQVQALQQREAELKQDLHSAEAAQRAAAQQTVQAQQAAAQSEAQAAQAQAAAGAARQAVKRAASAEEKAQQLAAAQQAQQAARSAESTAKAQARAAQQARAAEGRQAAAAAAARSTLEKWQQHILDQKSSLSAAADKQAMRQARAQQAAAQAQAQAEQQAQAAAECQARQAALDNARVKAKEQRLAEGEARLASKRQMALEEKARQAAAQRAAVEERAQIELAALSAWETELKQTAGSEELLAGVSRLLAKRQAAAEDHTRRAAELQAAEEAQLKQAAEESAARAARVQACLQARLAAEAALPDRELAETSRFGLLTLRDPDAQQWKVSAGVYSRRVGSQRFQIGSYASRSQIENKAANNHWVGPAGDLLDTHNRSYTDGYLQADDYTGLDNGTWNWGYESGQQVKGDVIEFSGVDRVWREYSRELAIDLVETSDGADYSGGLLLEAERYLAQTPHWDCGVRLGLSRAQTFQGSVAGVRTFDDNQRWETWQSQVVDQYDISDTGITADSEPYRGTRTESGPVIDTTPLRRWNAGQERVGVDSHRTYNAIDESLDLDLSTLSLGLSLKGKYRRFYVAGATGPTLNLAEKSADYCETLYQSINGRAPQALQYWEDSTSGTEVLFGYYVQGEVGVVIYEGLQAGIFGRYDWLENISGNVGQSRYEINPSGGSLGGAVGLQF